MKQILTWYAKVVGLVGTLLLAWVLATDNQWVAAPHTASVMAVMVLATMMLRRHQIPLTKYGTLNLLGVVAVGGSLTVGAPMTAASLYLGLLIADRVLFGKKLNIAWINAGREVLALLASYGAYAWAAVLTDGASTDGLTADDIPSLALYVFAYFFISRALLYFTLLFRDKLLDDEKSLILRYEVVGFGADVPRR